MEGDICAFTFNFSIFISIHSLRMEGDTELTYTAVNTIYISIHSLRMEGDIEKQTKRLEDLTFQSTPSAWRETTHDLHTISCDSISIHSLRMEGDSECISMYWTRTISIHSLRMEGDRLLRQLGRRSDGFQSTPSAWRETRYSDTLSISVEFQSTPSAWRETYKLQELRCKDNISIHSLRMEGDLSVCLRKIGEFRISIHSLRMEGDEGV